MYKWLRQEKQIKFLQYLLFKNWVCVGFFFFFSSLMWLESMAFHIPTSLKASMFLSAARAHQSSAVAFFTWKPVTLPPSRCKVLSPSNTDQIWAPYFIKHFQRTPQDNNILLRDGVRIIHQEVALFITSTSNDIEAHFPRQHHVTQTQHALWDQCTSRTGDTYFRKEIWKLIEMPLAILNFSASSFTLPSQLTLATYHRV